MKFPGMPDAVFTGEGWTTSANTSSTSGPFGNNLTLEKLQAAIRSIPKLPPLPKYDIYPSAFADKAYDINTSVRALAGTKYADRRMIVAPPADAWRWYTTLRDLGADVRWQPGYGMPESERASDA